jgi:hypothetical protein
MAISFECRECGKKLKAPDAAAGKSSKCPGCGAMITCPNPASAANQASRPAPPAKPAKPPAEALFENLDDGTPYGLMEPEPDPYTPPKAATEVAEDEDESSARVKRPGKTGGKGKKRALLRKIAVAQKGILAVILFQILVYIVTFLLPPQLRIYPAVVTVLLGLAGLYFIVSMAMNLYSTAVGILLCILSLIPCVSLIVLLSMNGKATTMLRDAGHHVGFMGANLAEF